VFDEAAQAADEIPLVDPCIAAAVSFRFDLSRQRPSSMSVFEWDVARHLAAFIDADEREIYASLTIRMKEVLRSNQNEFAFISQGIAKIFRHTSRTRRGAEIGADGYWYLQDLLEDGFHRGIQHMSPVKFVTLILNNHKIRLEFNLRGESIPFMQTKCSQLATDPGTTLVWPAVQLRARQGHSVPLDPMSLFATTIALKDVEKLQPIMHGTSRRFYYSIMEQGLKPGVLVDSEEIYDERGRTRSRTAVHFMAQGLKERENLTRSRVRADADLFFVFDLEQWIKDGKESYLSANGVVNIFEVVPKEYFLEVLIGHKHHPDYKVSQGPSRGGLPQEEASSTAHGGRTGGRASESSSCSRTYGSYTGARADRGSGTGQAGPLQAASVAQATATAAGAAPAGEEEATASSSTACTARGRTGGRAW